MTKMNASSKLFFLFFVRKEICKIEQTQDKQINAKTVIHGHDQPQKLALELVFHPDLFPVESLHQVLVSKSHFRKNKKEENMQKLNVGMQKKGCDYVLKNI